jgi:gallidermin/nisin family lantibiotic
VSTASVEPVETIETVDLFDLDIRVGVGNIQGNAAVTSWSYCTPGCTSSGGGSGCSHCC